MKEACRGFSHIRNAEQLGPDKRIIYTEALKGKGKLSSFTQTDEYKCTHEATLTQSSKWTTAHTHRCTIVHLSGLALYSERQWRDLTWYFKAYCCCQLSCHSQPTRAALSQGEFFGEVKGGCGGVSGFDLTELEKNNTSSVCLWPSFPGHSAGLKGPERRGQAGPGQCPASLSGTVKLWRCCSKQVSLGSLYGLMGYGKPCWGAQRAERDGESAYCQSQ